MPVARGTQLLSPKKVVGPTVVKATIYFSEDGDDQNQYQLYVDQNNDSALAAINSGGKWILDQPVNGGGMWSIKSFDNGNFLSPRELKAGSILEAVDPVHATLYTFAHHAWNGTTEFKFELCPNGTGLVAGMGAVKGSSIHNGADWENVRQLQLMPRIYDYASSQGMYSLQGAAVSV